MQRRPYRPTHSTTPPAIRHPPYRPPWLRRRRQLAHVVCPVLTTSRSVLSPLLIHAPCVLACVCAGIAAAPWKCNTSPHTVSTGQQEHQRMRVAPHCQLSARQPKPPNAYLHACPMRTKQLLLLLANAFSAVVVVAGPPSYDLHLPMTVTRSSDVRERRPCLRQSVRVVQLAIHRARRTDRSSPPARSLAHSNTEPCCVLSCPLAPVLIVALSARRSPV